MDNSDFESFKKVLDKLPVDTQEIRDHLVAQLRSLPAAERSAAMLFALLGYRSGCYETLENIHAKCPGAREYIEFFRDGGFIVPDFS